MLHTLTQSHLISVLFFQTLTIYKNSNLVLKTLFGQSSRYRLCNHLPKLTLLHKSNALKRTRPPASNISIINTPLETIVMETFPKVFNALNQRTLSIDTTLPGDKTIKIISFETVVTETLIVLNYLLRNLNAGRKKKRLYFQCGKSNHMLRKYSEQDNEKKKKKVMISA